MRVFRARIGRRIAVTESSSDGAMDAGNSMGSSGGEMQSTGMEEEEEALVIENVCCFVVAFSVIFTSRILKCRFDNISRDSSGMRHDSGATPNQGRE